MKNDTARIEEKRGCTAQRGGFTIIELMLVIGIGMLLLALTIPVGLRFYQLQVADETVADLESSLRTARTEARLGRGGNASGVKFFPDSYVRFEGASFDLRDRAKDVSVVLPSGATITTIAEEIVFAPVSGFPNATGTLTVALFGATHAVSVNDLGVTTIE